MEKLISVDIILSNPAIFYRCMDCETIWDEAKMLHPSHLGPAMVNLPKEIAEDYLAFSQWVNQLLEQYPGQVNIHIIDAISLEGITKSSQYGINYYPAVIINHRLAYSWQNLDHASAEIEHLMEPVAGR